jgi:hypothetical protein
MKQAGKSGGPNKRQTMIDISEKLGLSGEGREKQDIEYDIDERYDEGGVEEKKAPFDYTKFFRKRRADGGAVGIASMMPSKKIKGQDHILAYITPKEADKLVALGGKETMTKEGIPAYPEYDNYGYSSQQDFDQGNYGRSNDPTVSSYAGGNNLTDQTNINKKITEEINKKLTELKPPVIDYTKQKFDNLEKFRTLRKAPISFSPFRFDGPKNINKTLFDNTISELALSYPDLEITDEFGMINTNNLKTAIDSAVATGKISPVEGLTLTQSITTQGDPSGIGLAYNNNLINFSTPDINQGDYTLGTNYQIGDLGVASMFDVKNDALSQKKLSFDYGDGTLTGSQVTYPGSNFQTNELALNKNFNVTDNIDVNVKGDLSNLKMDGSTLYTDKSLTPTVTYTTNIGDGSLSLSGGKEIIGGGVKPDLGLNFSYPVSDTSKIGLTTNNLLSEDRSGILGFSKNIGQYGDNTFLDASVEVNPFNTDEYTGMLKFQKKFADGGRVGFDLGGLTGPAKSIYDSMMAAGYFTEDEIRNAIINAGYEIPGETPTQDTGIISTAPNIINQGGGGGDGPPPGPTFNRNDLLGTTDYFPAEPFSFSDLASDIADYVKSGGIFGAIGKGIKGLFSRNVKDYVTTPQLKARDRLEAERKAKEEAARQEAERQAAFEQARRDRDAAVASGLDAAIREGRDTSGFDRPSSGAYAEGAGMGVGGGYASDFGYDFKNGGLATMFKEKR